MNRNIDKLKQLLKDWAKEIRETRIKHKEAQSTGMASYSLLCRLNMLKYNYRHHHIAYCLLRGRTIEQIEAHVRDDNQRDDRCIQKLMTEYAWSEEDIKIYNDRRANREKAIHTN